MSGPPVTAPPEANISSFIDEVVLHQRFSTYPLVDEDGRLTGLVTLNRIRQVPPDRRRIPAAGHRLPTGGRADGAPGGAADRAAAPVGRLTDGRAVVVDPDGRVIGVVSPRDVTRMTAIADLRDRPRSPPVSASRPGPPDSGQSPGERRRRRPRHRRMEDPGEGLHPVNQPRPGRANDALASTAHTGTPAGNAPVASTDSVNRAAAGRSNPQGAQTTTSGAAARTASQVVRKDRSPGSPRTHSPPAAMTISGTQ